MGSLLFDGLRFKPFIPQTLLLSSFLSSFHFFKNSFRFFNAKNIVHFWCCLLFSATLNVICQRGSFEQDLPKNLIFRFHVKSALLLARSQPRCQRSSAGKDWLMTSYDIHSLLLVCLFVRFLVYLLTACMDHVLLVGQSTIFKKRTFSQSLTPPIHASEVVTIYLKSPVTSHPLSTLIYLTDLHCTPEIVTILLISPTSS